MPNTQLSSAKDDERSLAEMEIYRLAELKKHEKAGVRVISSPLSSVQIDKGKMIFCARQMCGCGSCQLVGENQLVKGHKNRPISASIKVLSIGL